MNDKKLELTSNPFSELENSLGIPQGSAVTIAPKRTLMKFNDDTFKAEMNDEEFVATGLKEMIINSQGIIDTLSDSIKTGTDARTFEVYGQLLDTITRQFSELRQLREASMKGRLKTIDLKIKNKSIKKLSDIKKHDKISMNSSELMELINKASENSEIKRIDAHFKITKVDGEDEPENLQ